MQSATTIQRSNLSIAQSNISRDLVQYGKTKLDH